MNGALLSSKKMDYCTPQGFFDTLNSCLPICRLEALDNHFKVIGIA